MLAGTVAAQLPGRVALAELPDFAGRPVVELIEALREQGMRIVYSEDLLPARLLVTLTPDTDDELDGLRRILDVHRLGIETGPRDTLIVVEEPAAAAPRPAPGAAPPRLTPPSLETVIVTASRYPIERSNPVSQSAFQRHVLETTPALGQDPLRVTHRLPGITSDQLTSRMHVRGGTLDEVLLTLDGVRLFSPYHLKDFQNVFSSINPRVIESMDVRTGGYEARLGDALSGVIEMQSLEPTEFRRHELAVSFLETSVSSSGLFDNGRGSWLTSLRRGNLDVLADVGDSGIGTPQYVDFFNKLSFTLQPGLMLETGMLSLDDKISLFDEGEASAAADYDDAYVWLTLSQSAASGLEGRYRIAMASLERSRNGRIDDSDRAAGSLEEDSAFDRLTVAADWSLGLNERLGIAWGFEAATADLAGSFRSAVTSAVPIAAPDPVVAVSPPAAVSVDLGQSKRAVYASLRYRLSPRVVTELGLRGDEQSLTGERQIDPRFGLLFDMTDRTSLRAAWGRYSQSDSLSGLAFADGITRPQPAQKSTHLIVGLDHAFAETGLFRVEIYEKRAHDPAVRFENLFERVSLLPELLPDRFAIDPESAETRGVELSVEGGTNVFGWWANLALARTREHFASGTFRRSWDERRSIKAGGEWSTDHWTVTASLAHRSGWPISTLRPGNDGLTADEYNAVRLPDFATVDVRASRSVDVEHGDLSFSIEVSNLFDHANTCCLDYRLTPADDAPDTLGIEFDELLGIVPNFGLRWAF